MKAACNLYIRIILYRIYPIHLIYRVVNHSCIFDDCPSIHLVLKFLDSNLYTRIMLFFFFVSEGDKLIFWTESLGGASLGESWDHRQELRRKLGQASVQNPGRATTRSSPYARRGKRKSFLTTQRTGPTHHPGEISNVPTRHEPIGRYQRIWNRRLQGPKNNVKRPYQAQYV